MLSKPKFRKFNKSHKGRLIQKHISHPSLVFGSFGLIAKEPSRLTASQIYAAVLAIKRTLKREGKLWVRVFPHIPMTKKPAEVRMGKGKGNVHLWYTKVVPGSVLFELDCPHHALALSALSIADSKLPFRTQFIS